MFWPTTRSEIITTQGAFTWTPPNNVTGILVKAVAGGGGGGPGGFSLNRSGGGGGGAGEYCNMVPMNCTPGVPISGYIGAGGAAAAIQPGNEIPGFDGEHTTFGWIDLDGGHGGYGQNVALNGRKCEGGGVGGALQPGINDPGYVGNQESRFFFGGSSGAGKGPQSSDSGAGGWCEGHDGGAGSTFYFDGIVNHGAGGGGAASCFGPGGHGGSGNGENGQDAPYPGAGGGGGGNNGAGSKGGDGCVVIFWVETP